MSQAGLTAWVDIENPPQVQYLVPLVDAFRRRGIEVFVTARDYGDTFELLERRDVSFTPVGRHFGASKRAKIGGSLRRALELRRLIRKRRPHLLVSASRSATIAARSSRLPTFTLCDYEYVDLSVFRATRSYVVHPDVISTESFTRQRIRPELLIGYRGIKEDLTFAGIDVDSVPTHRFEGLETEGVKLVLVRPPAEESHYHRETSSEGLRQALEWLAGRSDLVTIYSPRYRWQADRVLEFEWVNPPIVLASAVDFVALYKAVDVVFSGGGTMAREAAYLGIPAVTIFRGVIGDVDRYLESVGRMIMAGSREDLERLDEARLRRLPPLRTNPRAPEDVLDAILAIVARAHDRTRLATR
jgi:predicted glycosyltransferase